MLKNTLRLFVLSSIILGSFTALADQGYSQEQNLTDQTQQSAVEEIFPGSSQEAQQSSRYCTYAAYRIDKVGYNRSWPDQEVAYEVIVSNIGDCNLKDIFITDYFPENTLLDSASPKPYKVEKYKAFWKVEWLPVGHSAKIKLKFKVKPYTSGRWITNNACAWNSMIGQKICAWASLWEPKY